MSLMREIQNLRIYQIIIRKKWRFFLLWSLWLTLEYFGFGPLSYLKMFDFGDSLFPMRLALTRGIFENGLNIWFSSAVSGFDHLALTALNIFQFDTLFFLVFPSWFAYGLVTFIQRFLAGYFTYRLCKDYLKLGDLPSLIAGLAYSMSFFYFQSQFAGDAGFPLILWSLEYIAERKNVKKYILAFLLGLFALFSSDFVLNIPFILSMTLAWFVLVRRKYSFQFLSPLIIFYITLLLGNIPTIWALLANISSSNRYTWDQQSISWPAFKATILTFMKDNAIYLIMGILGLYWSRLKEHSLLMVMVLLIFCVVVAPLLDFASFYLSPYIGVFSSFSFGRFSILAPFFAVVALAYGIHLLNPRWILTQDGFNHKSKYSVQTILCGIVIVFIVINSLGMKYEHGLEWVKGNSYAVHFKNPDLQQLSTEINPDPFRVGTVGASPSGLHHPAVANAYGLETVDGYVNLYPRKYRDFWGKVIEPLTLKDEKTYLSFQQRGNVRVYLYSPWGIDFNTMETVLFSEYYNLNLLSLANTKYLISEVPLLNENLTLLTYGLSATERPRHVISRRFPSNWENIILGIRYNFEGKRLYIYKNELYLPRFFLTGKVLVFKDAEELLAAMAATDIQSLRNNVFIEKEHASQINHETLGYTSGEITVRLYSPDRIKLSVNLDKPGILVVSNNYSPYWVSKVNSVEKDIFPVYHTFMGIFLEEGESLVELEYRPPYRSLWLR